MGLENNMLLLAKNDKEVSELILNTTNDELNHGQLRYDIIPTLKQIEIK